MKKLIILTFLMALLATNKGATPPCGNVCGCAEIDIDYTTKTITLKQSSGC